VNHRPLSAALLCAAALLAPSRARADAVDDLVARTMAAEHAPGVSVAVLKDGKVVKAQGYGLADAEKKEPATVDTVYQLASVTKQFTAAGVLLLVEEGQVGLDDAISKHLPDLPEPWRPVTVRQLLTHTGGVPSYTEAEAFGKALEKEPKKSFTPKQLLDLAAKPLHFAPGAQQRYSNTGYVLLGLLIEKAGGKPWGEFLKARIFEPMGMKDTRANDLAADIPRRAQGYTWTPDGQRVAGIVSPTQPYAAGALVSTVQDMAKWDAALSAGRVLKPETWKQAWTPVALAGGKTAPYGFGWAVDTYRGLSRVHHNGGIPGFSTSIVRFPEQKTSVVILANSETADAQGLALKVAALYIPEIAKNAPKSIADADLKTTDRLRGILASIAAGKADENDFAEPMRKLLFPDRVAHAAKMLTAAGSLTAFDLMAEGDVPGLTGGRRREYRATFGALSLRVVFAVEAGGKIAGMTLRPEQ
jgi:CubicO group peptidase (beta-lactamase class C family)